MLSSGVNMKILTESEITDLALEFTPSSVYIDGIQTFDYSLKPNAIVFNKSIPAGSEITLVAATDPVFEYNGFDVQMAYTTVDIVGPVCVFSDPFGVVELSTDGVTWQKSLYVPGSATIHLRHMPDDPVLDLKCNADIELVLWAGDNAIVDETGHVYVTQPLPTNYPAGGLEFYVR